MIRRALLMGLALLGLLITCPIPAYAVTLPPRPEQTAAQVEEAIAAGQCPEQAISRALPDALPACDGIILPLVVWAHLEQLADDSRTVRALYALEVERAGYELAVERALVMQYQEQLELERAPVPVMQRPGVRIGAGMAGGAAAVLLGAWAVQLVGGA